MNVDSQKHRKLLIADDEAVLWAPTIAGALQNAFQEVSSAEHADQALTMLKKFDESSDLENWILLLDIHYGKESGFEILKRVRALFPNISVVMFSSADDPETMIRCHQLSVGYLSKTRNSLDEIASYLLGVFDAKPQLDNLEQNASELAIKVGAIFQSDKMKQVFLQAAQARQSSDAHVIIRGEQGVGKELIAKAIGNNPLTFNCAGITDSLLESELFGHEKGSFTGAATAKVGLIEAANGGDLFLDEFGELSLKAQASLLRLVEYGEIKRVGSHQVRSVKTRIIGATNAHLEEMAKEGSFREDFLSRFSRVQIRIPSLRERPEDIEPLVEAILKAEGKQRVLSQDCLFVFRKYSWPGNVRELRETLLAALDNAATDMISFSDLPWQFIEQLGKSSHNVEEDCGRMVAANQVLSPTNDFSTLDYEEAMHQFEESLFLKHMDMIRSKNIKVTQASLAKSLGIPRSNLRRKLEQRNITI